MSKVNSTGRRGGSERGLPESAEPSMGQGGGGGTDVVSQALNAEAMFDETLRGVEAVEAELMSPEELAHHFLYQTPQAILDQVAARLQMAGGNRPGIKAAVFDGLHEAWGEFELSPEKEEALIIALKIEFNRLGFGPSGLQSKQGIEVLPPPDLEKGKRGPLAPKEPWKKEGMGDRRAPKKEEKGLKLDGKTRFDFNVAFVIFIDRRRKGQLEKPTAPAPLPTPTQRPSGQVSRMFERMLASSEAPFVGEIARLVEKGTNLSSITRRINKSGDPLEALRRGLSALGVNVPPPEDKENIKKLLETVRAKLNLSEKEGLQEAFNRLHPDHGEKVSLNEFKAIQKKFPLLYQVMIRQYFEENQQEIPTQLLWVLAKAYQKLKKEGLGEGASNYLKLSPHLRPGMREEILARCGVQMLTHFVKQYKGRVPTFPEIIDTLLSIQASDPDLVLENGTYKNKEDDSIFS